MSDISPVKTYDSAKLRQVYESNPHAKSVLDRLAQRRGDLNGFATTVDQLTADGIDRGTAVWILRQIAAAGCGVFFIGRRGLASRIEWSCSSIEAAKSAQGTVTVGNASVESVPLVKHSIWLRPGLQIQIEIPEDTTKEEAERLAGIVRNLWLAGDSRP